MDQPPSAKPKRGRRRALDEVKRREVCALISAGCSIADAAKYVGCVTSTIHRELDRNPEFREYLRRAKLTNELGPLNALRQASHKHWRAAAWLLERTNPQRFAKQPLMVIKPEQFKDFCLMMIDVVKREVRDPDVLERIANRFGEIEEEAGREAWAMQHDPFYEPRRVAKRAVKPPIPPWANGYHPHDDSPNALQST